MKSGPEISNKNTLDLRIKWYQFLLGVLLSEKDERDGEEHGSEWKKGLGEERRGARSYKTPVLAAFIFLLLFFFFQGVTVLITRDPNHSSLSGFRGTATASLSEMAFLASLG